MLPLDGGVVFLPVLALLCVCGMSRGLEPPTGLLHYVE